MATKVLDNPSHEFFSTVIDRTSRALTPTMLESEEGFWGNLAVAAHYAVRHNVSDDEAILAFIYARQQVKRVVEEKAA